MKQNLKKGQASVDVERLKGEEAKDLGVQDFFNKRDRSNRGASGLVQDTSEILNEEVTVKERLYEDSHNVSSIPGYVSPMFAGIFLTAKRNKITENGIYLPTASYGKGTDTDMDVDFSEKQFVLAVGPHTQQVCPGMEVVLNMDSFKKRLESTMAQKLNKEFEYILPIEIIEGKEYLYITERDIKYISNTNGKKMIKDV
jgi:hypothetical protein